MANELYESISAIRRDIQDYLVHFTRSTDTQRAFDILTGILKSKRLAGSSSLIKGNHRCVCFSEAPLIGHISNFNISMINDELQTRYAPFGLLFKKSFIFDRGGRPVIYQPESDYGILSRELQYRHVTFDLGKVDFTWEREWRMQVDKIEFTDADIHVLVPSNTHAENLFLQFSSSEPEFGYGVDGDEFVRDYLGHSAQYNLKVISLDILGLKDPWD